MKVLSLENKRFAFGAFVVFCGCVFGATRFANGDDAAMIRERTDAIRTENAPDARLEVFDVAIDSDAKTARIETTSQVARAKLVELAADFPDWRIAAVLLPDENPDVADRSFGLTNFSTIQLQKKPDFAAELGTQSLMGWPVRILRQEEDGWILVRNQDGYLGYTTRGSVRASTRDEFNRWVDSTRLVWVELFGFVYSEPDENSPTISDLTAGNITVWKNNEASGDFCRVETPDGRIGWIRRNGAVEWNEWIASRSFDAEGLAATAKRLLGTPYVWGGVSAKGVDCSGLTSFVFFLNRTNILRDVSLLQREGVEVDLSNGWKSLQKGDLLIFGQKRPDGSARFRHVAIYLGDGRFIHSATSVHVSSLDPNAVDYDEVNARELIKAVRYVGAPNGTYFKPLSENPMFQRQ